MISGDEITVSDMVSTTMACDEAIMNQEDESLRILARAVTWHVDGGALTIATGDGDAVTLTATTEPPEATALAWIEALAAGDLDAAASLLAPASFAYVDEHGGLAELAAELSEGWGAWARVDDRRAWSLSGQFPDGSPATAVVLVGTVQQEGVIERRAVSILMDEVEGRFFVQPFVHVEPIGFVVPRTDFVDRVAPDVPFELAVPESFEVMVFLDDSGPLPTAVVAGAGG